MVVAGKVPDNAVCRPIRHTAIRFTGVPQGETLYKPLAKDHHAPANVELLLFIETDHLGSAKTSLICHGLDHIARHWS